MKNKIQKILIYLTALFILACNKKLDGLRVALLDDVMTTGASLNALASTVKSAGAAHVECWTIARTLPQ